MSEGISETRLALNDLMPANCDCNELSALANAYDASVREGRLVHAQAVAAFEDQIDTECGGKIPREQSELSCFADGCGVSQKVCRHSKYLIAMMMKVRSDTGT